MPKDGRAVSGDGESEEGKSMLQRKSGTEEETWREKQGGGKALVATGAGIGRSTLRHRLEQQVQSLTDKMQHLAQQHEVETQRLRSFRDSIHALLSFQSLPLVLETNCTSDAYAIVQSGVGDAESAG